MSESDVTRRDFVRTTAAVSAAAATLPTWAYGTGPFRDTIRVGLVGCGGRGTGAAGQAVKADPNAILTAASDAFPERIDAALSRLEGDEAVAERLDVQKKDRYAGFDGYKQLIDSGVDVVLLATPPVFRPEHLEYAVAADKHVFCEKPVAVDAPGVRSVLSSSAEAKRRKLALVSGFCWRYNNPQRAFYQQIHDGAIGEMRAMQSTYNTGTLGDFPRGEGMSDMEWQLRNWKAFIWTSGDHIVEQAIHAIDWFHWAMQGRLPVRCFATGGRQCRSGEWTGNLFDHFSVVYEWENGVRGYHTCRQINGCDNDNTAFYMGSKGTAYSNPWRHQSLRITGENAWRFRGQPNDMYQTEHDEMFESIRNNDPINNGQRMAESTMMGLMGRMAAYTGKTLSYEQCFNSTQSLTPRTWAWGPREFPAVPMPGITKFE